MTVESTKLVTDFLSNNFGYILILALITTQKKSIHNLITRLEKFSFKNGDSEIGVEASSSDLSEDLPISLKVNSEGKVEHKEDNIKEAIQNQKQDWYSELNLAFSESRFEDANCIFEKYSLEENDVETLINNKSIYLYRRFETAKDDTAIDELKKLAESASNENSKYNVLKWLSYCYVDGSQLNVEIELWKSALKNFTTSLNVTKATINLARCFRRHKKTPEAKLLLTSRLNATSAIEEKSLLFADLSAIEKELGNKTLAVYCKDKSIEYSPNDRAELFNAAYLASEEGCDDISICNYSTLINIDQDNANALNNLGVRAKNAKLMCVAVDKYKMSAKADNHTLAMANQGYMFLNAGFLVEAEEIAKSALKIDSPHKNVYTLLSEIENVRERQYKEWTEITSKSYTQQQIIRKYTEAYYHESASSFNGQWLTPDRTSLEIVCNGSKISVMWDECIDNSDDKLYECHLTGEVTNSSFKGVYKKHRPGEKRHILVPSKPDVNCLGFLSQDGLTFTLHSDDSANDFSISFKKEEV